jgi:sterol desaturase/sphingolipid hydroxylase (fatty acid hydroxylase superfamily)
LEVALSLLLSAAVLGGVYLIVGVLERVPALRSRTLSSPRPYFATDLAWYGVAVAATAISVYVLRPVLSRFTIGPLSDRVDQLPLVLELLVGLVVFDFVSFAVHRGLHGPETLWNFHKVHHSTLELDGLATTRTHMLENFLRFVPAQVVLVVIGLPATVVTSVVGVAAIYGVSNHCNLHVRANWIEAVLVTPRLHHRHHVPSTTQANYGVIFTIWDRIFGSLVRRDTGEDERFGVPGEIDTYPQRFGAAVRQPFIQNRQRRRARLVQRVTDAVRTR